MIMKPAGLGACFAAVEDGGDDAQVSTVRSAVEKERRRARDLVLRWRQRELERFAKATETLAEEICCGLEATAAVSGGTSETRLSVTESDHDVVTNSSRANSLLSTRRTG